MILWKCVFWVSCFVVFYNYAGYAIVAFIFVLFKKEKQIANQNFYPSVSFIVAAYNEEDCIQKKIENSLQQIYPPGKIELIFITDGSTDSTPDIVRKYSSIQLLHTKDRKGKSAALNRAVENASNEILIFSDANTILNAEACLRIAQHYVDESVGGVAGEKKVIAVTTKQKNNAADSEGFYWKYESALKKIDSAFHTVVGAAGELFSVRKHLYDPVPSNVILDDFVISIKIALKGFRIVYEPNAFAMELPSFSIEDEKKRKVRIAAGGFQAVAMLPEALFFWKHLKLSFLYISHRVLRWTLSPLCLISAFLSNFILFISLPDTFYKVLFLMQFLFYCSAFLYGFSSKLRNKIPAAKLAYYFTFMNVSVFEGFLKFIKKNQSAAWEKAKRTNYSLPEIKNH